MKRPPSRIFDRLTGSAHPHLTHPTNKSFDADVWMQSTHIDALSKADESLFIAGLFFGREITALREHVLPQLFEGCSQPDVLRLAIAAVNRQVLVGQQRLRVALHAAKSDPEIPGHLGSIAETMIETPQGDMKATAVATAAIDALPHWFAQAVDLPPSVTRNNLTPPIDLHRLHVRAALAISTERALRDIWQSLLWEPWAFTLEKMMIIPLDMEAAKLWLAWNTRQDMLNTQLMQFDTIHGIKHDDAPPVVEKVVREVVLQVDGRCRIRVGKPTANMHEHHYALMEMAEHSYLSPFLDTTVPKEIFAVRDLMKVWLVLDSLASALVRGAPNKITKPSDLKRLAFEVPEHRVQRAVAAALGTDVEGATRRLAHFTCVPTNLKDAFEWGVWHRPLVRQPGCGGVMVLTGVLQSANFMYMLERIFQATGLAARMEGKSLGLAYEDGIRKKLSKAVDGNRLLTDAKVAAEAIKRVATTDEEIDCVVRVGRLIVVCEIKCFVRPTDPINRHNYIQKLEAAAEQAERKAAWLGKHLPALKAALHEPDLDLAGLQFLPVVILNNAMGSGLKLGTALVTDAHWLEMILHSGSFGSGVKRDNVACVIEAKTTDLYKTQEELATSIETLLVEPTTLRKLKTAISWDMFTLPTLTGRDISIARAVLDPVQLAAAEMNG